MASFLKELKLGQVYFRLTQLIDGTFPRHFLKKSKQKSKQWHNTIKRASQNSGCQKKKFKIFWENFQHRAGSICSKLDSTLVIQYSFFLEKYTYYIINYYIPFAAAIKDEANSSSSSSSSS